MKKVLIINGSGAYIQLFKELGFEVTHNAGKANLAVFTGGADVTPALYGDKQHQFTGIDSHRDEEEAMWFNTLLELNVPMVGICRGGQFLNVMSGGRMYQHVGNHTRSHSITDLYTGETVYVSSTHHQMMMPSEQAEVIAVASEGGFREWYDGQVFKRDVSDQDYEVVYYNHTNALCFQPHPEFNGAEYEGMKRYFQHLLSAYLGV
jgi:gamma-glutamyl-gamma-aminobutyrate hydrolase PuuD